MNKPIFNFKDVYKMHIINPYIYAGGDTAFKFTITGSSFTLPTVSGQTYNAIVDWGDGSSPQTITAYNDPNITHAYGVSSSYQISITGKFGGLSFNNGGDRKKMDSVDQWGNVGFDYLRNAFYGCVNMTSIECAEADMSNLDNLFRFTYQCFALTTMDVSNWDISNVTNLTNFVTNCVALTSLDVSSWDTSSVIEAVGFIQNVRFTTLDVTGWDVSNVRRIENFAFNAINLTTLDTSSWDTSAMTHCHSMCKSCTSLTSAFTAALWWSRAVAFTNFTDCFTNAVNISNYIDIPFDWKGMVEVGTITSDQSILQTVGINRTYTGIAEINWGDGTFTRTISGIEATKDYGSTGIKVIKLGAISSMATSKFIADNNRITNVSGLKTGLLIDFRVNDNLYAGSIDLSNAPVSNLVYLYDNPNLTNVIFANSGNAKATSLLIDDCDITGNLDLSNLPIGGIFQIHNNTNLTGIIFSLTGNTLINNLRIDGCNIIGTLDFTNVPISESVTFINNNLLTGVIFATSGNAKLTSFTVFNCNLTGTLDFTNIPVSGVISASNNSLLTGVTFATSGNTLVSNFQLTNCGITGVLDLSNVPIGGFIAFNDNINLTNVTFSTTGNVVSSVFVIEGCNLTGTLDLSNVPIAGAFDVGQNALLTNITLAASGNGALTVFRIDNCAVADVDFSVFPTSDGVSINATFNNFTATEHDNQLINLDNVGWVNGGIQIVSGNTTRTSASDTAYNNLITKGWTIT